MIKSIKNVCAIYGLGNAGSEYKIIIEIFLYKFLNDKFLYEARKEMARENPSIASLSFFAIEDRLKEMSKEEFENIKKDVCVDSAKVKKENLISTLYNQQNMDNFH